MASSRPVVDREKTCPFLLRTFIKVGGFHRISLFEDNILPVADEQQVFTWKDATLSELVTTLRALPPNPFTTTLRHPIAKFSFRVVFADPTAQGRIATKDVGTIYARDLTQLNLIDGDFETEGPALDDKLREKERKLAEERTLEELRFVPGDWLDVAVILPTKAAAPALGSGAPPLNIRGANGDRALGTGRGEAPWGESRGGGFAARGGRWGREPDVLTSQHWRGGGPKGTGIGRGASESFSNERGRGGYPGGRGNVALNRRGMPRRGSPDRTLGGAGERSRNYKRGRSRSASMSRSRSRSRPPRSPRSRSPSRSPPRRRD